MTQPDRLTSDLPKRLRIVSDMINMGEKISWGEETALMDEAAAEIERLRDTIKHLVVDLKNAANRGSGTFVLYDTDDLRNKDSDK